VTLPRSPSGTGLPAEPHEDRGHRLVSAMPEEAADGLCLLSDSPDALLAVLAGEFPDRLFLCFGHREVRYAEMQHDVLCVASALAGAGIGRGSRVVLALENSVEHVALVFALFRLGAQWVPVNPKLRGDPLGHLLRDAAPSHVVTCPAIEIARQIARSGVFAEDARHRRHAVPGLPGDLAVLRSARERRDEITGGDVAAIMYTSGTTGPAKGVIVTRQMLWAAALGCLVVTEVRPGDVLYVWEPLYHIGGAQLLLLPLIAEVSLALAPGFSARRFWADVAATGATHIHYLGGILQILQKQAPSPAERSHRVRIGWGAGATGPVYEACANRFGIRLHECYGMTETSSIVTVNKQGPEYGVGFALPWFDVRVADAGDTGPTGEILVRSKSGELTTPGYLNAVAGSGHEPGGWLATGDIGSLGDAGDLHFHGRQTDSVRHRGENVSAWEIESAYSQHPGVLRCAVIRVPAEIGEDEIAMLVVPAPDIPVTADELADWARGRLADFQIPRYIGIVPGLPLTPSERIAKQRIRVDVSELVDLRAARLAPARKPQDVADELPPGRAGHGRLPAAPGQHQAGG
jgi:crotonobetaine/carnitine-CoA ligase